MQETLTRWRFTTVRDLGSNPDEVKSALLPVATRGLPKITATLYYFPVLSKRAGESWTTVIGAVYQDRLRNATRPGQSRGPASIAVPCWVIGAQIPYK